MARSFGKVFTTIWRDAEFLALSTGAQRLYLLFVSSPDLSHAGVLPMRLSKWAKSSSDSSLQAIDHELGELSAAGFVLLDECTEEVLVRSFIKNDEGYKGENMRKAVVAAIEQIESGDLRSAALASLMRCLNEGGSEGVRNPFEGDAPGDSNNYSSSSSKQLATTPAAAAAAPDVSGGFNPLAGRSAAAAAIEILVQHRLDNPDNPIRSRAKYADRIRNDTMRELGGALNAAEWPENADAPRWLAENVLGLSRDDALRAASALRRKNGKAA